MTATKETVGRLTGNRRTQREGVLDQVKANAKDQGERMRDAFRARGRRP
ncbi:CsbD family protein [Mycobacterium palustre]|nr:CsbD family protein [Mycobacterium palustre]